MLPLISLRTAAPGPSEDSRRDATRLSPSIITPIAGSSFSPPLQKFWGSMAGLLDFQTCVCFQESFHWASSSSY